MAKLLFISNISDSVGSFAVASIAAAKKYGLEFYYASNWSAATDKQISYESSNSITKFILLRHIYSF